MILIAEFNKSRYEKNGFTKIIGHGSVPCEYDLYLLQDAI